MKRSAMRSMWKGLAVAFSIWLFPGDALAGSCSFVSADAVLFGTYDVFDPSPIDATGSITYSCSGLSGGDAIVIELSAGASGSAASRYMEHGTDVLHYNLYRDAAHTLIWGNGFGGTMTYGPITPPNDTNQTVTIYGRMPALQNVSVGSYADAIIATILF